MRGMRAYVISVMRRHVGPRHSVVAGWDARGVRRRGYAVLRKSVIYAGGFQSDELLSSI